MEIDNFYQFLTSFLPNSNYSEYLVGLPYFDIIEERFTDFEFLFKEFQERVDNNSNYNLFIFNHFRESGTGKSTLALYIAELFKIKYGFEFLFFPSIEHFLIDNSEKKDCVILIDDTTTDEIGLGSKRFKKQMANYIDISARHKRVCFIFTTTKKLEEFDFLNNIHRLFATIGFNKKLKLTLSYTFQQAQAQAEYVFSSLPSKELNEKYLVMKQKYTDSFDSEEAGNITIKSIVVRTPLEKIKRYNKQQLTALLQVKMRLTTSEIRQIAILLKMKEELLLGKSFYSLEEYLENKEKIDSNIDF